MNPAVRAVIITSDSSILLTFQPDHGRRRFFIPGGSMERSDEGHRRTRLQKELREELGLDVSRANMHELHPITTGIRNHDLFFVSRVRGGIVRINPFDRSEPVLGLGFWGGGYRIPHELLTGHVAQLGDFYRKYPHLRGEVTEGLVIPEGLLRNRNTPIGVISWDAQRRSWRV
ncbi:NUDIX hydrolase [Candidatus Daviesbacteria bacterium]|nr:NUDIX hydrolase [Candidatus Daviesbacteria bacterium]